MSGFTKLEMAVISVRVQRENTKKDAKKLDILLYDVSVWAAYCSSISCMC